MASRRWVQDQADPLAFLVRVMNGEDIDGQTPTMAERLNAARELRRVIVPDAKDQSINLALPAVTGPSDFTGAMSAVLSAVSPSWKRRGHDRKCQGDSPVTIKSRIARLEAAKGAERVFCVRRYEGETTADAFAAEHPGETAGPNDLVVVTVQFSGLTRANALQQQRENRSPA